MPAAVAVEVVMLWVWIPPSRVNDMSSDSELEVAVAAIVEEFEEFRTTSEPSPALIPSAFAMA
jgi:hypothetical protein